MVEITVQTILAYTLENAIKYKGKASQGSILASLFAEGLQKSDIPKYIKLIQSAIEEVNKLSLEQQQDKLSKLKIKTSKREVREGLKELPNAKKGHVVMRMAPFPSGPLHIGNARNMILNDEYCKMYKGKLLLVFDDTIGGETKQIEPEAYKLIEEGIKWLGVNYEKKIIYKSDRTEKYYTYAEEMLKKGYLYVCDCSQDRMHDLKVKGIECPCRNLGPEIQLGRWKEMFGAKEGSMCVRLKTSMSDPDPAFRDRVMLKISDRIHARTKNKFRIYPTMEFSWGIDDYLIGSTHILRGTDHHMSTRVQDFIRGIFGWPNPTSIYNGMFAIEGVKISKSQGTKKIKSQEYVGWNDPRTWSLQSLKDRGIRPEAIRGFILNLGMKKTSITTPVETLYSLNKKYIEDSQRYFFVENPKKITIKGCPMLEAKLPLHPSKELGQRIHKTTQEFLISQSDFEKITQGTYRLLHLLNFKSDKITIGSPIYFSFISTEPSNDSQTKFLHWLPLDSKNINVEIMMPTGEIKKGLGEHQLGKLKKGTTVQFERFGFATLYEKSKDKLIFWFAHN
jgi:glutamyl-tRNA synthetase